MNYLSAIWNKVFKNEPSKICGRQPLKNLLGPFVNILFHMMFFIILVSENELKVNFSMLKYSGGLTIAKIENILHKIIVYTNCFAFCAKYKPVWWMLFCENHYFRDLINFSSRRGSKIFHIAKRLTLNLQLRLVSTR